MAKIKKSVQEKITSDFRKSQIQKYKKKASGVFRPAKTLTGMIGQITGAFSKRSRLAKQQPRTGGSFVKAPPRFREFRKTGKTPPRFVKFKNLENKFIPGPSGQELRSRGITMSPKGLPLAREIRKGAPPRIGRSLIIPEDVGVLIQPIRPGAETRAARIANIRRRRRFLNLIDRNLQPGRPVMTPRMVFALEVASLDIDADVGIGTTKGLLAWATDIRKTAVESMIESPFPSLPGSPPHRHGPLGKGLTDIDIAVTRGPGGQTFALVGPIYKSIPNTVELDKTTYIDTGFPVPRAMEVGQPRIYVFPINNPETWKGPIVYLQGRAHAVTKVIVKKRPFMKPAAQKTQRRGVQLVASNVAKKLSI